jgi:hypothetical protein
MKYQNYGHFFGYKQHMQNSLLLNNTIGNGYFAVLQHAACYSSPAAASAASELAHNTSSILRPNKQTNNMKFQKPGHSFGYKKHMRNSLFWNYKIGNGYSRVGCCRTIACGIVVAKPFADSFYPQDKQTNKQTNNQQQISKSWSLFWIQATYAKLVVAEQHNW